MKLELNENKMKVVLTGLAELPAKMSFDVIVDIHKQIAEQNKPIENSKKKGK